MLENKHSDGSAEAHQALDQLIQRITRNVGDITTVLAADLPKHVQRSVRGAFEASPSADAMSDAQVAALKQDTQTTSQSLGAAVVAGLTDVETWLWPIDQPLPEAPEGFEEHPRLAEVLAQVPTALASLLGRHGLTSDGLEGGGAYRAPAYFVAGHFMKSLLADYWRALLDHTELRRGLEESGQAETRQARRERWDQA